MLEKSHLGLSVPCILPSCVCVSHICVYLLQKEDSLVIADHYCDSCECSRVSLEVILLICPLAE